MNTPRVGTTHSLTCVQEEMVFEVGVLGKAARANVALERPRSTVNVHMGLEIAGRWKRFGTQTAFVWFFLYVRVGE